MHNHLEKIIADKLDTIAAYKATRYPLSQALQQHPINVIAEIKRHSPAKGPLATIDDPCQLAQTYLKAGASSISVLTDPHFQGSLADLTQIAALKKKYPFALLRKDFIVDEFQLYETVAYGADAVLLIVALLQEKTAHFLALAQQIGLECLVEVHTQPELIIALESGATIIGINNRNLTTFEMDMTTAPQLKNHIPSGRLVVAESGIQTLAEVRDLKAQGFAGILVGSTLVTHANPAGWIEAVYADR